LGVVGHGDDFHKNPNPDSDWNYDGPKKEEIQKELGEGFACVASIEIMNSESSKEYTQKNEGDAAFGI
jgi:hypothetical protein